MIARYEHLHTHPSVFRTMTGLSLSEFDALNAKLLPSFAAEELARHSRHQRMRCIGGGNVFALDARDQLLVTLVWLRRYPTHEVLAWLFGVSDSTTVRIVGRMLPLLAQHGHDTMRFPDPGKHYRRKFDQLLAELPELSVIIDSFEQRVQRPTDHDAADTWYSGKKKTHTIKSQVAVDVHSGKFCHISDSVRGPTSDFTLLKDSAIITLLPPGVGAEGDLAYIGIADLHPQGLGATPRRKPRGQERPPQDKAYNKAFATRRVLIEHEISRLRNYECLSQRDREHRENHQPRVVAVAGLVNFQIDQRLPHLAA